MEANFKVEGDTNKTFKDLSPYQFTFDYVHMCEEFNLTFDTSVGFGLSGPKTDISITPSIKINKQFSLKNYIQIDMR